MPSSSVSLRIIAALTFISAPSLHAQLLATTNKEAGTSSLLDLKSGTAIATLPTGEGPHELAASPDGKWVVVADYGGRMEDGATLTVIDVAARKVARTIA